MLNLSNLFYTGTEEISFIDNLDINPNLEFDLNEAKKEVREALKEGLPRVLAEISGPDAVTQPRFFTQGSWAYKTINYPAQSPQQADLDDGAYLPLSFVSGVNKPSIASQIYFKAVEKVLEPLAKKNGWALSEKPTCTRLVISTDAHIDIPLYAIPDNQFLLLKEAATLRRMSLDAAIDMAEQDAWTSLPENVVLLAHRMDDWKVSDPRPIKKWFLDHVDIKGEQLRRVIRYLKAFRDKEWASGGPSSILLMAAAVPLFEKRERRDDLALLDVLKELPVILRNEKGINNPVDPSESLTQNRISHEDLMDAADKFEELGKYLTGCINATNPSQACIWLQEKFGDRFPNMPERVSVVSATETITAAASLTGATPLVGRTQAG